MKTVRRITAAFTAAIGCSFIYVLTWQPLQCDIAKNKLQRFTERIWDLPAGLTVTMTERQRAADLQRCIKVCPADVDLYMTLGAADQVLGRLPHAADNYQEALKYDRRPELFLNLGLVQLALKQHRAAVETLAKACAFEIRYAEDIPDPTVREEVLASVRSEQAEHAK
jgi:tetratricopeptide (TPR) repeat protein